MRQEHLDRWSITQREWHRVTKFLRWARRNRLVADLPVRQRQVQAIELGGISDEERTRLLGTILHERSNIPAGTKAGPPVFDDHVQRQFRPDAPNRVWLTDITEHWTSEGKLYCCAIKDVDSNRIVGYSISDRMTAKLAVDALRNAVTRRRDVAGCILHADRGSQFRSRTMARELHRHDMVGSMGRVGAAGDNAAMESFWSLVQTNVLNQQRWTTRQELRLAIVVWIERKYHRQRAQDALGGLTPIEFEAKLAEPLTLAA